MEKIKIKHVGFDSWDREVFQTQKGTYVVDISLDYSHQNMRLCTKNNNEFDGEPDTALKTDAFEIAELKKKIRVQKESYARQVELATSYQDKYYAEKSKHDEFYKKYAEECEKRYALERKLEQIMNLINA